MIFFPADINSLRSKYTILVQYAEREKYQYIGLINPGVEPTLLMFICALQEISLAASVYNSSAIQSSL